jgi:2-polyprenyl-6-methoxyphenol hydroxylase-like FAD-dependent oxidoreductase
MTNTGRTAVVVGAGIGGLTSALALAKTGWRVTVLERTSLPVDVGAGISLWPNAMRVLDLLDVGDRVREVAAPLDGDGGLRLPSGRWLSRAGEGSALVEVVIAHRADLHHILRAALPDGALHVGATQTGVRIAPAGSGAEVEYDADGARRRLAADLVVGADGLRSGIRGQLWPAARPPVYRGYTSWRAVTPADAITVNGGGETWGAGERFGYLPLTGGRVYWFAVANATASGPDPAGPHGGDVAAVRRRLARWHHPVPQLLDASPDDSVLHLDICDLPALPTYVSGPVALLGDAAHAMTPDMGQGGCQAIEDAAVLAASLRGREVPAALARYDAARRRRTQAIVRASRQTGRFAQWHNPAVVAIRNAAIRLTPPAVAMRPMARVSAWTPPDLG